MKSDERAPVDEHASSGDDGSVPRSTASPLQATRALRSFFPSGRPPRRAARPRRQGAAPATAGDEEVRPGAAGP
jgi:hypothetical protein